MTGKWKKAARDLSIMQGTWAAWLLAAVLIGYVGAHVMLRIPALAGFINETGLIVFGFHELVWNAINIFMLVIGIMSCYAFLEMFVGFGVTRRSYYKASIVSALLLAAAVNAAGFAFSPLLSVFFGLGGPFSWGMEAALLPAYIMTAFIYYLAGWIISVGFYRWQMSGGFIAIAAALLMLTLTDRFWNFDMPVPFFSSLMELNFTQGAWAAAVFSLILTALALAVIQKAVYDIPVKIK
ncbi:hypothetical protein [Alkalicoccus luteus]|uniref:Uncharacterized protein n=1 Tax=Alkalicoccus luteus TaxID=1237094 RepID=A0A969PSF5_9BACI|nr:hypothetical protein [Alkalicoccus luteus]NJP37546.1 hypothetical protein [Alkalicoccus luteus]